MREGDLIGDRFELITTAGAGGMADVWRALDRTSGTTVAVKVMRGADAEYAARFARETMTLEALQHDGIVRYVAHGETTDGSLFLAMEWLDGEDLSQRLARHGLTVDESVAVAHSVAVALSAAHARNVVHRDIKPGNIFLLAGRVDGVRVLDFGIARQMNSADAGLTGGGVIGTAGYMAPEQARGEQEVDCRADVFSLGCVLFECISGRRAFEGSQVLGVLLKVLLEEPPRLADVCATVPLELDALVSQMLAKDPNARPIDGRVVAEALRTLDLGGVAAVRAPLTVQPPALTHGEQRLFSVIVAHRALVDSELDVNLATAPTLAVEDPLGELRRAAIEHGAELDPLADGSVVAVISGKGLATDLAARAARCALAIRKAMPSPALAISTGRGDAVGRVPTGEVVERAAALALSATRAGPIALDATTAGLLDGRFEVAGRDETLVLISEREQVRVARTLCGKTTPCVGRDREISILEAFYNECVEEPMAHAILMTAPAGVGKSRVRYELLRRLAQHARPPQVWLGRGDELSQGSAFKMIRPPLRDVAGIKDDEPPWAQQQKLRARVGRSVAPSESERVTIFLGELMGLSFESDDEALLSARADALVMVDQVRLAWQMFLRAETSMAPVLLVLEDLHFGDPSSIRLLDQALRNVKDHPWMILALARPEVTQTFPGLWKDRRVEEMRLAALSARASEKLVRSVLGDDASAERVAALVKQSEGNALYLEEFVRAEAEGQMDVLPPTVLAIAQSRLAALETEARRVLRAASVFGQVFWANAVVGMLGGADTTKAVHDWLSVLDKRELIVHIGEQKFSGERAYAFRHILTQEAAYSLLTDHDRALAHRLAAEWLESAGETDALVIAHHFERGRAGARAVQFYIRAGQAALDAGDLVSAIARANDALRHEPEAALRGSALRIRSSAQAWRGENELSLSSALAARDALPAFSDGWYDMSQVALSTAARLGRYEPLREIGSVVEEKLVSEPAVLTSQGFLSLAGCAAEYSLLHGDVARGRSLVERLIGTNMAAHVRARLASARATIASIDGDPVSCAEHYLACYNAYTEAGDRRATAMTSVNVAYAYLELGDASAAKTLLEECVATAEQLGLIQLVASARTNLGWAYYRLGAIDDAARVEHEAADVLESQGDRRMAGGSRIYLSLVLHASGEHESAESEARHAVELLEGVPMMLAYALAAHARTLASLGNAALAMQRSLEAMAQIDGALGEAFIRLVHAELLDATGARADAAAAISVARDRVLASAGRITSPEKRTMFLENIAEHTRTLALAREWLNR